MNKRSFDFLDPVDQKRLSFKDGFLIGSNNRSYPIINAIPRFVSSENYSKDFGDQWIRFPKTQLDSHTKLTISEDRLARCFNGELKKLYNTKVLEAGSGAGRFTEVLLKYGAIVDSFDYSNAVEANAMNNGGNDKLRLVQADIRMMPFLKESYDYVVCLGVLQHTPNPEKSIEHLWSMVRSGGVLIIDHYHWNLRTIWPTPIGSSLSLYRRIILSLPRKWRFKVVKLIVDFWFPIHWRTRNSLLMHKILRRFSPVFFYYHDFKLRDRQMYYEWALLDTHDATTDFYKKLRTLSQIKKKINSLGAVDQIIRLGGNGVEVFCRKPN